MKLTPYLNFDGQCAEAFRFYEKVLGGKLEVMSHGDSPIRDQVPPDWHDRVMHARLVIGDQVLMASDNPPGRHEAARGMYVTIGLEDTAEGKRVFDALAENGTVQMPFAETFWAAGFGMLVDRFGTPWMINCQARPA